MPDDIPKSAVLDQLSLELEVHLGGTRLSLAELENMNPDTVIQLDQKLDDPVTISVGGSAIAEGWLEEIEDETAPRLGIRISRLVSEKPL